MGFLKSIGKGLVKGLKPLTKVLPPPPGLGLSSKAKPMAVKTTPAVTAPSLPSSASIGQDDDTKKKLAGLGNVASAMSSNRGMAKRRF